MLLSKSLNDLIVLASAVRRALRLASIGKEVIWVDLHCCLDKALLSSLCENRR
jgi:hypothetical protein